jgi:hypothetical protein
VAVSALVFAHDRVLRGFVLVNLTCLCMFVIVIDARVQTVLTMKARGFGSLSPERCLCLSSDMWLDLPFCLLDAWAGSRTVADRSGPASGSEMQASHGVDGGDLLDSSKKIELLSASVQPTINQHTDIIVSALAPQGLLFLAFASSRPS